jgi:glycosyltransferase involved in cell wall biosynthesis
MRIALISTPFVAVPPRFYGGTEYVVHELASGLVAGGHDVEVFATGDSRTTAKLRWLFSQAQWPPEMLADLDHVSWAMQQIAERGSYDLVHAHSAVALGCARLLREVPMVYTLHHERDEKLSALYRHCPAIHYIAISEDQRRREIPLPDVTVIHHGLDPARYQCVGRATGDYVCFIGRFSQVKGPHTAIDAAGRAGVPIRVAGEVHPPDESWAASELQFRLRQPHVSYEGTIGLRDKAPLLAGARALLAPIEWNEPFGLVLIEAMLSGCPVVAYRRGSVAELVEDGLTGFVPRSFDDMVELIRRGGPIDGFDRRRCRERAIERFSRDRMVADHVRLYERILARRPSLAVGEATSRMIA